MSERARRMGTWIAACAVGEALGLTASGAIAALVAPMLVPENGVPDPRALRALMIAAGALEGAILGAAQAWALRRIAPRIPRAPWTLATAIGMAIGWAIGTFLGEGEAEGGALPSLEMLAAYAAVSGVAIGVAIGTAQSVVLRRANIPPPPAFRLSTAAAWTLAMLVSFLAAGLLPAGDYDLDALALGLATGTLMGTVVGATTAPFIRGRTSETR